MSEELKPCPFCGSRAKLEDHRTIWAVRCECGCCVLGERAPEPEADMPKEYWSAFEKSAIDAWNRRAQPAEAEGVELTGEYHADCNLLLAALSAVTAERDRLREEMAELWKRIDKFQSQSHGITALAEIERLRAETEALRVALLGIASVNPAERGIEWAKSYASDGLKGAGSELYARWLDAFKEAEALRKDAERYRWLRGRLPGSAYRIAGVIYSEGGDGVDAAVDAAMAAKEA